ESNERHPTDAFNPQEPGLHSRCSASYRVSIRVHECFRFSTGSEHFQPEYSTATQDAPACGHHDWRRRHWPFSLKGLHASSAWLLCLNAAIYCSVVSISDRTGAAEGTLRSKA